MKYIMEIVKSVKNSALLMKGVTQTTENETKEEKRIPRYAIRCTRRKRVGKYVKR